MATKENPNFKSFDDRVPDVVSWFNDTLAGNINNTRTFYKQCPPWEVSEWEKRELMDFKIEVEKIDRVYHVKYIDYEVTDIICMYCRMDYKGRSLYFLLKTSTCNGGSWPHEASLYLTFNVGVFVKAVVRNSCRLDALQKIWKAMIEDGVVMKIASFWEDDHPFTWRVMEYGFPTLEYLCHLAIFDNRKKLKHYPEVLPDCMTKSVDQYIKIWRTQDHLEKYRNLDESDTYSDVSSDCDFKDGALRNTCSDDNSDCDFKDGAIRDTLSDKYDLDESDTCSDDSTWHLWHHRPNDF